MNSRHARILILGGIGGFLLFTGLAAFSYNGGSGIIPEPGRFSLLYNFFSDLGVRTSYAGTPVALKTRVFFAIALTSASLATALFFNQRYAALTAGRATLTGRWAGYFTALSALLIPVVPSDAYTNPHRLIVLLFIAGMSVALGVLAARSYAEKGIAPSLLRVVTLITWSYLAWIVIGPLPDSGYAANMVHAVAQKIVVYSFAILTLALCFYPPVKNSHE
jgi:hypothetical protein